MPKAIAKKETTETPLTKDQLRMQRIRRGLDERRARIQEARARQFSRPQPPPEKPRPLSLHEIHELYGDCSREKHNAEKVLASATEQAERYGAERAQLAALESDGIHIDPAKLENVRYMVTRAQREIEEANKRLPMLKEKLESLERAASRVPFSPIDKAIARKLSCKLENLSLGQRGLRESGGIVTMFNGATLRLYS